jgi:hypothetical protein
VDPKLLLIPAVILVVGWFGFGIIYNLRHGEAILRWMQNGLPRVGQKTTLRWLGTSVAQLVIAKAKGPIRSLETLLVLAPRDVPWLWLLSSLQGRRDTLIFRAQLGVPPLMDLELVDPASWTGRSALKQALEKGWVSQPYHELQLLAAPGQLQLAQETLDRLDAPARDLSPQYRRFSLRRDSPHLELHLGFPNPRQTDPARFFDALISLARAIGERG